MPDPTEAQRRAAEQKRLIFENLVNGVPAHRVAEAFKLSVEEVQREFLDVLHKIKCYMRERNIVGFDRLEVLAHAIRERTVMLHCLSRLGPIYLSSPPKFKAFETLPIDDHFVQEYRVALLMGRFAA